MSNTIWYRAKQGGLFMILTGEKVKVRNLNRQDIPLLVKWKNDPEIADLVRGGPIHTTFDMECRRFEKSLTEYNTMRMIIETLSRKPIGFISLGEIDRDNRKAEIGMLIGEKEYWDQGYGTDSLITLLDYLFREKCLNRVGLEVFEYNTRAKRAYEKIGFTVEGVQRKGLFRKNAFYDVYLMGILREDFEAAHNRQHQNRNAGVR